MNGVSWQQIYDALTSYYFTNLDEASARGNSVSESVERFADMLLYDDGFGGTFLPFVLDGSAEPHDVYGRLREVVNGEPAGTRLPPVPGSAFVETPAGEVAIGPLRALFNGRTLIPRAANARVVALTGPMTTRGLPRLSRIERVYLDGMRVESTVDTVLEGGFRVHTTPYTFSVRDRDGVLLARTDLRDPFAIKVGRIRDEGDLRLTFYQYQYDLLHAADAVLHSVMVMTQNTRQLTDALRGKSDSFVLKGTLEEIRALTSPLAAMASVASGAFSANALPEGSLTRELIQKHVSSIGRGMLPVAFIVEAPALSQSGAELALDDGRSELAVRYSHIADLINGEGLGTLLNPAKHVMRVYGQRFGNVDIDVETMGDPSRQLDPIAVRLILDEVMMQAALRGTSLGLRLLFDNPSDMVMASFSSAQPQEYRSVIKYLGELWGYSGQIGFDPVDGDFTTFMMSRSPDRTDPEDTLVGEVPRFDKKEADTEREMPTLPGHNVTVPAGPITITYLNNGTTQPAPPPKPSDKSASTQPAPQNPLADTSEIDVKKISTMPAPASDRDTSTEIPPLDSMPTSIDDLRDAVAAEDLRPTTPAYYAGSTMPAGAAECMPDTLTPSVMATLPCLMIPKMR